MANIKSTYIENPQSIEDYEKNVNFQLSNVRGWIIAKRYENAIIKLPYLLEALEKLQYQINKNNR